MDYYQILQINRKASHQEIKKAYKKLSSKYHPDNAGEAGRDMFEQIQRAYWILGDESKRQAYDDEIAGKEKKKEDKAVKQAVKNSKRSYEDLQAFYKGNYQNIFASFFGVK